MSKVKQKEPELLKSPAVTQRRHQPLAGFWMRSAALLLDLIFLRFFLYALVFLGKEYLFMLGFNSLFIGLGVILGYFWLMDGALGKGKTIGKMLLNIAILNYDARPLAPSASFKRTIICLNVFILSTILGIFFNQISTPHQMFMLNLVSGVIWGFLIANGILIGVHPLKQGIHDLLSQSIVAKEAFKDKYQVFREKLPEFQRMQSGAFQSAAIGFIVMVVLSGVMNFKYSFSKAQKEQLQRTNEVRQRFAIEGFELVGFNYGLVRRTTMNPESARDSLPVKTTPTTTTQQSTDDKDLVYAVIFVYRTYHSFDKDAILQSRYIERLMRSAGLWAKRNLTEPPPSSRGQPYAEKLRDRKIERIYFIFEKRINLTFLYQYSEEVRRQLDL
ncbi:RDD family protein [Candidatus Sumerlaeota bacterium]|nr:RDD family protein [Candidatus Sumerlaeota bacterium]